MPGVSHELIFNAFSMALKACRDDTALVASACERNSWFSPDFIRTALNATAPWFNDDSRARFISRYGNRKALNARVGIIAAGNLPAAGLHDLFTALLAGCKVSLKQAHKDDVLLPALAALFPSELRERIEFLPSLKEVQLDAVIATGSDNSARYFEHDFKDIPRLIRRNRYSIALLNGRESDTQLQALCDDLLLYCGLGCRNVSVLVVPENPGEVMNRLCGHIQNWNKDQLPGIWGDTVAYERAVLLTAGETFLDAEQLLLRRAALPLPGNPGVVNFISSESFEQSGGIDALRESLQCVVGINQKIKPGQTQHPAWDDFADDVNTFEWLWNVLDK